MGNKLGQLELTTGHFMLEAIRKDDEEAVMKALKLANSERVMTREEEHKQGLSAERMVELKNQVLLDYFGNKYNAEGTRFKGNLNKVNFVEYCLQLGFSKRARQIQHMWDEHRKAMGLETDPVELNAAAKGETYVSPEAGTRGLSSTGKDAKSNLEAWVAKRNAAQNPTASTKVMDKLKAGT